MCVVLCWLRVWCAARVYTTGETGLQHSVTRVRVCGCAPVSARVGALAAVSSLRSLLLAVLVCIYRIYISAREAAASRNLGGS